MERTASCPSCRRGVFANDAFCSWCGARVKPESGDGSERTSAGLTVPTAERLACASCNSAVLSGDVFCATCGAPQQLNSTDSHQLDAWAAIPKQIAAASSGKYEFIRELGRGGMGIVFQARDTELERNVAIKVLSPSLLTDEAMVTRFQREARTIASLRHESIVTVHGVGRAGNLLYFVMDHIAGVSLSQILRVHGRLPITVVEAILYRVGLALSHAHRPERAIIHRDIKPSNVMLDPDGHAILMDFGISKVSEKTSGLTVTGLVMGTPEYMSPEQCRGLHVTPESDQYSLGAVVYAMLTGAPPFTGPFYQVLMAHQVNPVPPILDARPECPPALAAATERMLAKLPGDRWPSIHDALRALGLRPSAPDDPVIELIGWLVRQTPIKSASGVGTELRSASGGTARTPTSIRILPSPEDLEVGDELNLTATALFADGVEESWSAVSWESTDPAIARVDSSSGQLIAIGSGAALITAAGGGVQGSLAVDVKEPRVVQILIEPGNLDVEVGGRLRLHAEPQSKRGIALDRAVAWSSSDPRIASVGVDGTITAYKTGAVSVLAHCAGTGAAAAVRVVATREVSATEVVESSARSATARGGAARAPRSSESRAAAVAATGLSRDAEPAPRELAEAGSRSAKPRARGRYLKLTAAAVISVVILVLTWPLIHAPNVAFADLAFADFADHVANREVTGVQVFADVIEVQLSSVERSGDFRIKAEGAAIQMLLASVEGFGVSIEAVGQSTAHISPVRAGSNEPLPDVTIAMKSEGGSGCDRCRNEGETLAAGWYSITSLSTEWQLDSIRVGAISSAFGEEALSVGQTSRIFVPPGGTLQLTVALVPTDVGRLLQSARAALADGTVDPNVEGSAQLLARQVLAIDSVNVAALDILARAEAALAARAGTSRRGGPQPGGPAVGNPIPAISELTPSQDTAGGSGFILRVLGQNFVNSSKVHWNGVELGTRYVTSSQLDAQITASDIASAGQHRVTVFNPPPLGGISPPTEFVVVSQPVVKEVPPPPTRPTEDEMRAVRDLLDSGRRNGSQIEFAEAFSDLSRAGERIQAWQLSYPQSVEVRSLAGEHQNAVDVVRNQCVRMQPSIPGLRCN